MGAWGTGILEDDEVLDVVSAFFHAYDHGATPEEASAKVRGWARPGPAPRPQDTRFWLGLAHAQWECKALAPETLAAVEHIVRSDEEEGRGWGGGWPARREALATFLASLKKPKAKARRRQPAKLVTPPFPVGSCLAFPSDPGRWGTAVVLATSGDDRPVEHASTLLAFTSAEGTKPPSARDVANASTSPGRVRLLLWRGKDVKAQAAELAKVTVVGRLEVTGRFDDGYGIQSDWDLAAKLASAKAHGGGVHDRPEVGVAEVLAGPSDPITRELADLFVAGSFRESADPATRHREAHARMVKFLERCLALGLLRRGDTIGEALSRPAWRDRVDQLVRAFVRPENPPFDAIAKPVRRWHQGDFAGLIEPP